MAAVDILSLLGVSVFAVSGALAAGRKGLDWVGAIVLAALTAIGGGTIRDVLLDRSPVFWIQDTSHLWVIFGTTFATFFYCRFFDPPHGLLRIADALGLALFAILGAQVAESMGVAPLIVLTMGVITGVAGGMVRDALIGEIPMIFRPDEAIYSVACVVGILVYLGLKELGMAQEVATGAGIITIATLRIIAIIKKINVPAFKA